jgi:hypothetical protein
MPSKRSLVSQARLVKIPKEMGALKKSTLNARSSTQYRNTGHNESFNNIKDILGNAAR